MDKKFKKSVFIFRRDLRLEDNSGLLAALDESETVLPIFIFDDRQIELKKNDYFSAPAFSFMLESLTELSSTLESKSSKLFVFHGSPEQIISSLIKDDAVDAVYVNKDYTPFARKRDKDIADICEENHIPLLRFNDCALSPLEDIRTGEEKVYTVFTPFMKKAMKSEVENPKKNNFTNYFTGETNTKTVLLEDYINKIITSPIPAGRKAGLKILKDNQYLDNYKDRRNIPSDNGTSRLSAHHKFGTVSIRESYHMAKEHSGPGCNFISELYWRDFYMYIAYHFPIVFKKSFLPWAKHLAWINDEKQFKAWCDGKTGVPMVDAGMRELNETGWMHNRSRMIVASYLTKNLLINWQWGEKYFATKLVDYDPAQNNGGWQWSASTGADPKPLRIFNPYTQAVNYDSGAKYIKKWIPELTKVDSSKLADGKTLDFSELGENYPTPLVDQRESFHRAMEAFRTAKEMYKKEKEMA
jgi:deoxyribodipyrimidine photo-lyase